MTNLDRQRANRDAQHRVAATLTPASSYGRAVNRYLGAFGYLDRLPTQPGPTDPHPTAVVRPTVAVGVHDSPASSIAVDHAGIEAELRGADLRLILIETAIRDQSAEHERGAALLTYLVDRVHAGTVHVSASSRLLTGSPATLLLDEVRDADLVVVGSEHGRISDAAGTSVSAHIAAHHPGPVMVVRMPAWPAGTDFTTRPIVVGIDGTASDPAVAFGLDEARLRGCELILLHAADSNETGTDQVIEQAERTGVKVHRRTAHGSAITALTEASLHAAAVIIGGRGHHGLPGLLLGSVGQQLIRQAHSPVFIVR
ncbi:universal stress protein [Winogradskya humida]|uniref:Universal stress protein n=1 Tax=Winogradskya humida TaxID=113566 RepID=A0ABQ3ZWK9_9ACTN|nr:universal stress protein [Actinoplanes humidus]GIE22954.1 universal stress protein [Actinoplanes humidus]